MRLCARAALTAAAAVATVATGCSSTDCTAAPSTTAHPSAAITHSSSASADTITPPVTPVVNLVGPSPAPLPAPSPSYPALPARAPLRDIDCGLVTGSNGATANAIAVPSDAGAPAAHRCDHRCQ